MFVFLWQLISYKRKVFLGTQLVTEVVSNCKWNDKAFKENIDISVVALFKTVYS